MCCRNSDSKNSNSWSESELNSSDIIYNYKCGKGIHSKDGDISVFEV